MTENKRKRKPGKSARAPKTAREMLDQIDRFLNRASYTETRKLWHVMTALRGPDDTSEGGNLKLETTVPIRRAAFPRFAANTGKTVGADFRRFSVPPSYRDQPKLFGSRREHFNNHAQDAARALGLTTEM